MYKTQMFRFFQQEKHINNLGGAVIRSNNEEIGLWNLTM